MRLSSASIWQASGGGNLMRESIYNEAAHRKGDASGNTVAGPRPFGQCHTTGTMTAARVLFTRAGPLRVQWSSVEPMGSKAIRVRSLRARERRLPAGSPSQCPEYPHCQCQRLRRRWTFRKPRRLLQSSRGRPNWRRSSRRAAHRDPSPFTSPAPLTLKPLSSPVPRPQYLEAVAAIGLPRLTDRATAGAMRLSSKPV